MSKTVTLNVDGKTETVRTFGGNVNDVLSSKGITLKAADKISPAVGTPVADGQNIDVQYARPLILSVDGVSTAHVFYAAPTVQKVLNVFDVKPLTDAYMSAKPATVIPRSGLQLVVSNPKKLKVVADGHTTQLTTAAPTVSAVLAQAGVKLGVQDEVKQGVDSLVTPNADLKVVRVKTETKTEDVSVKLPAKVQQDSSLAAGQTTIVTPGKPGKTRETVIVTMADGKVRNRTVLQSTVLTAPVQQVEKQGSKAQPSSSSSAPVQTGGAATGNSVWDKIAQCESGGNWQANTGNGYYGGLQFSAATWHSVGGSGLPSDNSREEQIKRAKILQARSGWGQWGCAGARFN